MKQRLLSILAHPDDETLALGGVLARYAAAGVEAHLVTATSGDQGWQGPPGERPGAQALARIREAELRAAAAILGLHSITLLRYPDGRLAEAPAGDVIARLAQAIRRIRPQVVVTFGPDGATGHPDHMAICQLTTAALVCAADPAYPAGGGAEAHRVAKLYYLAPTRAMLDRYERAFGDPTMTVDGVRRHVPGWPEWSLSASIATRPYVHQVWRAICAHRSQFPQLGAGAELRPEVAAILGRPITFYRAYGPIGPGPQHEIDLFAGLDDTLTSEGRPVPAYEREERQVWEDSLC